MIGGSNWSPWNGGSRCEALGPNLANSQGTTITANASANTKGSWTDVGSTTGFPYKALQVTLTNNGAAVDYIVDVGINVGGNRFVIAEDLRFAEARRAGNEGNNIYFLPIYVPGGTQLSVRSASSVGSSTLNVVLHGFSAGLAGMGAFSRVRALYTPTTSRGLQIDPGGTINTKGAYAELVASSGFNAAMLMLVVGYNDDISRASPALALFDVAIGGAGSEQVILPNQSMSWGAVFDGPTVSNAFLHPFYIPSGTRLAARAQCNINTASDRTFELAAWGFEP